MLVNWNRSNLNQEIQHTEEWQRLVKLFQWCTESIPGKRPTATQMLQALNQIEQKNEVNPTGKLKFHLAFHVITVEVEEVVLSIEEQLKQIQSQMASASLEGDFDLVSQLSEKAKRLKLQLK